DISDPNNPIYFTVAEDVGHGVPYPHENYYRSHEGFLDISGDIVVWEGDGDIYGADISDLDDIKVFPICTAPERQFDPAVSDHRVVWTDERDDIGDIYGADISDPTNVREFAVWAGPGWQLQADIDGPIIVFSDGDDWSGRIRARCVTREYGLVDVVIPDYPRGGGPQVDGTTITWVYSYRVQGVQLNFGYGLMDGPIENLTTGSRHDYIQHAVSSATDGDVILVPEGTYAEKVRFGGRNVTVTSADPQDPAVRAATVITGGGQLVAFDTEETADCLFTGFTVTGGSFGIFCNGSTPTISHCDVTGNRDGGIKLWGASQATVTDCTITANRIGVEMWADTATRRILRSKPTLRNCIIAGNREYGVMGSDPTVENCTIADNLWTGLYCSSPVLTNSIVYFNNEGGDNVAARKKLTATYSDIQGGWPGEGNIDVDPLFVARGSWTEAGEWIPGDYHLKSEGWSWDMVQGLWAWDEATSPCIDAGDPSLPLGEEILCEAGDPLGERATNSRLNMGAYGGTAEASLAPLP
ncbi:MAG: right-handed parallel beta-helix repeat-containing protein, partial [Planctomycetota bacterium]